MPVADDEPLDVLKETELRGLTPHFMDTGSRVGLDETTLQRRLLLCSLGLGTNTGLKRVCATTPENSIMISCMCAGATSIPRRCGTPSRISSTRFFVSAPRTFGARAPRPVPRIPNSLAPGIKIC